MGEWLAPLLLAIRATGFFEWYVYMPVMTLAAIPVYRLVRRRLDGAAAQQSDRRRQHPLWNAGYFAVCFILTNALAVAVKTMIVEEMDYTEPVWFSALVSPLHFYIVSVAAAYLWLVADPQPGYGDWIRAAYVQVGLLGGYAVGVYRVVNEPFSFADPTTALGGIFLVLMFLALNFDAWRNLARNHA
jgi:hypothetical protein